MTLTSDAVVEHASTQPQASLRDLVVLSADDVRAAYRLADGPLPDARLVVNAADLSWAGHERAAETYRQATVIRQRRRAAANPIQGPVSWPLCGWCGVENVAWRVHCTAQDGGQLLVCDDHKAKGEGFVEATAVVRTSAVRVDQFDSSDLASWVAAA